MVKYGRALRERMLDLLDMGFGPAVISSRIGVPASTARKWAEAYRACGREKVLQMGSVHRQFTFEEKLAAVKDVVERHMTLAQAMREHGVASRSVLQKWLKQYREGGEEALVPGKRGRRPGSRNKPKPLGPLTREEALERELARSKERIEELEAAVEVAKKFHALMAERSSSSTVSRRG